MNKTKTSKQDEKTIEETLKDLEGILEQLERGDNSLEESFLCYEAGMKLVKDCNAKIDKVEKQIIVLTQEGDGHES